MRVFGERRNEDEGCDGLRTPQSGGGPGGVDAGGQNVHVAELSAAIAHRGHDVTVYTRRDDPDSPERATAPQGYTVAHVPAGPPRQLPMDELVHYMGDFAQYLDAQWAAERPDVAHAHSSMSGVATQLAARSRQVPTVQTFHALGVDKHCDQETSRGRG